MFCSNLSKGLYVVFSGSDFWMIKRSPVEPRRRNKDLKIGASWVILIKREFLMCLFTGAGSGKQNYLCQMNICFYQPMSTRECKNKWQDTHQGDGGSVLGKRWHIWMVLRSAHAVLFTVADGPSIVTKHLYLRLGWQISPLPLARFPWESH